MKITLATEISDNPLHKIFGGIPAGSAHPRFSDALHRLTIFQQLLKIACLGTEILVFI
jgi:hypothetical protein